MLKPFPFQALLDWHSANGRHDLPWRKRLVWASEKRRGYLVWLSEILLQQTQASRGAEYFERIVEKFPTVESLADTDFETFFPYYDGLGYYSRARNLLSAAKIVVEKHSGVFPTETESLVALPGVGPYTAEAIRSFAYGIATLSFDTNLEKIFSRYYFGTKLRKLTKDEKSEILGQFLKTGLPSREANAALMDYANSVSLNAVGKIDWKTNSLAGCRFFETLGELESNAKSVPKRFPIKDASLIAILSDSDGKTLYSSEVGHYLPFVIGPPEDRDPREAIKSHFLSQKLAVSVRPPYSKGFCDGEPLAFYRVRIQTGNADFENHGKEAFVAWWKSRSAGKDADFENAPA